MGHRPLSPDRTVVVMGTTALLVAVFAPLLSSLAVLAIRPTGLRPGRFVAVGCGAGFLASVAVLAVSASRPDGAVGTGAILGLHVDRASALLIAAVTATGAVVASFARRNLDVDPRAGRFFVLLGALVTGSGLVVVPGSALTLLVGWLGSTWALVGLIGHRSELAATRSAQRRTALALAMGDLALVLAVAVILSRSSAGAFGDVAAAAAALGSTTVLGVDAATLVAVLVVVAGASRSALVPFHRWLVATLAAPTPVSALVHAGFVSGAGLVLIRFEAVTFASPVAIHLAFALAVATVVIGVGSGATRVDVKGALAWSTVSQMGFMVAQVAVGAVSSAVLHIIGHGMYKATMFLGAGDAISARLRSSRRSAPLRVPRAGVRLTVAVIAATVAVGAGLVLFQPQLPAAGVVLVGLFAWATVANGVWGWLARGVMRPAGAITVAAVGACAAACAYLAGVVLMEEFLAPSLGETAAAGGVSVVTLLATVALILAVTAAVLVARRVRGLAQRTAIDVALERTAHPAVSGLSRRGRLLLARQARSARGSLAVTSPDRTDAAVAPPASDASVHSQIRADVARASAIIAPSWPLTSFVAVNPLGGLESRGFDGAAATARRFMGARTHLSLAEYRRDHAEGVTSIDDLAWAIEVRLPEICARPALASGGRELAAADIVLLDLLHGPDVAEHVDGVTALERWGGPLAALGEAIDATLCHSAAHHVALGTRTQADGPSFHARWRTDALRVAGLRHALSRDARRWLGELGDDPAQIIAASFAVTGIAPEAHVDEMRGHLARVQGWAGYSKWRTQWAHPGEHRPVLQPIDLVAARAALEAACVLGQERHGTTDPHEAVSATSTSLRVDAIVAALGGEITVDLRQGISEIVADIDPAMRASVWLSAQERAVDIALLHALERHEGAPRERTPDAQLVFCIDVRSEGLRRHLEAAGPYDTVGFAGFFGVALAVQRLEWDHAEARCPVLVTPSGRATERPLVTPDGRRSAARLLSRDRVAAGWNQVHAATKAGVAAPFVMAEAAGWFAGPVAAARTLLPSRPKPAERPPTLLDIDADAVNGFDDDQRVFAAETVLRTMSLTSGFAPLVVLCGHGSDNVNNPHATALDCGACAGAAGDDSARAVAALLNEAEVRAGLRERGIDIPDGTHVAAALHDTVSDTVTILDSHLIPESLHPLAARLAADLETAARRQSAQRAAQLPGRAASVRARGGDWAQVRPEWGLARNTSFIVGSRSLTEGLDLGGRSFLHSYDAQADADGRVLETIMTAPLVVAHWISAQYYFSTVDPEVFGAGDKLIHNVVGDIGVVSGEGGDLRVGLPVQSTHCGARRHHQPVRLLAVIEAPLERIERIIGDNPILTTLFQGSWMRVAGRSHPHEPWSIRTPEGTWSAEPRADHLITTWEKL